MTGAWTELHWLSRSRQAGSTVHRLPGQLESGRAAAADGRRTWPLNLVRRLPARLSQVGWWQEIARIAAIYVLYETIRLVPSMNATDATTNGRAIVSFEQRLHLDPEHALNRWLAGLPNGFSLAAAYYYEVLHYVVTPLVLVWLYRTSRVVYSNARNSLVAMTLPSLAIFWLLPTVPPRMLSGSGLHDIVAEQHRWGWWSSGGTTSTALSGFINDSAAMPSLHVAWAAWCGLQLLRYARHRSARILGVAYPVATAFVVIATANHYLADTVVGVLIVVLGIMAAAALSRRPASSA